MSYSDPSGRDADRYEVSGDSVAGTVKALRLHKQCWGGTWTCSMSLLVVDGAAAEWRVYDSSDDAERRFEALSVGDAVEASGRLQKWARVSMGGAAVPDSGFDKREALVADEIDLAPMPAQRIREKALERMGSCAAKAAAEADAMRESIEEFCGAGGSPTEAQEAVAAVLTSGAGIDDWLSSEAEMIVENWRSDAGVSLEM